MRQDLDEGFWYGPLDANPINFLDSTKFRQSRLGIVGLQILGQMSDQKKILGQMMFFFLIIIIHEIKIP